MPRKRKHEEVEAPTPPPQNKEPSLLHKIRNMWEFASVMQFIFIFGKAVKIDEDFDIEDFEEECLKPGHSEKLEEIGLTLLKFISSHRGLNFDIWDEYTRRQYLAKAPERNPYGDEIDPKRFRDFDVFGKIRILHQLTVWTLWNPDRIRERMPEHQRENDQVQWRIEQIGWDRDDRSYFVLDDNRLYRRTEPPIPPAPKARPKSNTIKARAARRRASKRRRVEDSEAEVDTQDEDDISQIQSQAGDGEKNLNSDATFGGFKWECVAITLSEYESFVETLEKTKDPNEKILRDALKQDIVPIIRAAVEKQQRKIERRERELMLMERMVGAKRSSRIAGKLEREKKEAEEAETARKKAADLAAAHRELDKQEQMEAERQSRMMTREQRIKDREYKRILMEEELARDAEEAKKIEEGEKRGSERALKERMEKNKKELEDLEAEEEWTFDCSGCGVHGRNIDDGSHSVACERCNVWQHSKCLGISKSAAEKDDFHFVCNDCRRKEEEASRPKISLKFRLGQSSSPPQQDRATSQPQSPVKSRIVGVTIPPNSTTQEGQAGPVTTNGQPFSSPPRPSAASPNTQANASSFMQSPDGRNLSNVPQPMFRQPVQQDGSSRSALHADHTNSGRPNDDSPHLPQYSGWSSTQESQRTMNGSSQSSQHSSQSASYQNGTPQANPSIPQPASMQMTPRPSSSNGHFNQPASAHRRLPSPVINRPTISPTQGNHDVGPIAGVPNSSPSHYNAALFTPQVNGTHPQQPQQQNGTSRHNLPIHSSPPSRPISQTPQSQQLSGLSPVKQRSPVPLPPPSSIPEKRTSSSSPTSAFPPAQLRSVSGTPIFPPAEKLAPSPEQLHREPVPTPSKQIAPIPMDIDEMRRESTSFGNGATHSHEQRQVISNGQTQPSQPDSSQ